MPDQERWQSLFTEGRVNIVPSFFKLLNGLKKAKREFSIVFRSFGQELPDIIWEFNKFCNGEHPCYNGQQCSLVKFDGSKGVKDLRFKEARQQGLFYRSENVQFVTGSLKRYKKDQADESDIGMLEDFYSSEPDVEVFQNDRGAIYNQMMQVLKKRSVMAI